MKVIKILIKISLRSISSGYERRHYPEKHRFTLSESVYKPRGRAHIPSPPLEEVQWRPHGPHIDPIYSKYLSTKNL
jgi:hypothetical protein